MHPTTVQAICCCGAVAAWLWRLCLVAAPAGINEIPSTVIVITGASILMAILRSVVFLDHAFRQRRQALATASTPLEVRGEAPAAFPRRAPRIASRSRYSFR